MQPEITREWLAEQLALCERAPFRLRDGAGDYVFTESEAAWVNAARTGYPAVLRKLMEAMERDAVTH